MRPTDVCSESSSASFSSNDDIAGIFRMPMPTPTITQSKITVSVRIHPRGPGETGDQRCVVVPITTPDSGSKSINATAFPKEDFKKNILTPSNKQGLSLSHNQLETRTGNKTPLEGNKPAASFSTTGLLAGTENKVRFDFDQVIDPTMTHEQCYQMVIGDSVHRNIKKGLDTTILVLGQKHSQANSTLHGDWNVRRNADERMGRDDNLSEHAGILPRAVYDMFQACQEEESSFQGRKAHVSMSYCSVPSRGGSTRDLLSRFRQQEGNVVQGITRIQVQSTEDVRRLLRRVTERRASDIEHGRTFHAFMAFHLMFTSEGGFVLEGHSSRLTIAKLATSTNLTEEIFPPFRSGEYSLKEVLFELVDQQRTAIESISKKEGLSVALHRQMDKALSDAASVFIIGCLAEDTSENDSFMGMLKLLRLAMDTQARYVAKTGIPCARGSVKIEDCKAVIRPILNRDKLSRGSTIAALIRLSKLYEPTPGPNTYTEGRDEVITPRISISRRNQPSKGYILRENRLLKASLQQLTAETTEQRQQINSLQNQLSEVIMKLSEERMISARLEGIRDISKRKMVLQDQRIEALEKSIVTVDRMNRSSDGQDCGKYERSKAIGQTDQPSPHGGNAERIVHNTLLSVFDESSTECSVFLAGEDVASCCSLSMASTDLQEKTTSPGEVIAQADVIQTNQAKNSVFAASQNTFGDGPALDQFSSCECQMAFVSSGSIDMIEFFLPSLNISCLCGKKQSQTIEDADMRLDALLRPWQNEFLASLGIFDVAHFIEMHREEQGKLPQELYQWRRQKNLKKMSPKACEVALLIWARTCSTVLRRVEMK